VARRLEGLVDEPRPGGPPKLTDEHIERVFVTTLETTPTTDATHWSTRSLARALGTNQTAVSRIWRAFGLKPHLTEAFKLSADPQFMDKVRDIVGLYLTTHPRPPWSCAWMRRPGPGLDRTAPVLPLLAGWRSDAPTTTAATA
jgi:hypothetical protein